MVAALLIFSLTSCQKILNNTNIKGDPEPSAPQACAMSPEELLEKRQQILMASMDEAIKRGVNSDDLQVFLTALLKIMDEKAKEMNFNLTELYKQEMLEMFDDTSKKNLSQTDLDTVNIKYQNQSVWNINPQDYLKDLRELTKGLGICDVMEMFYAKLATEEKSKILSQKNPEGHLLKRLKALSKDKFPKINVDGSDLLEIAKEQLARLKKENEQ